MNVNRRTAMLLVIVLVVIVGVYAITQWQRGRETANLLVTLESDDHGEATKAMSALRDRGGSIQAALIANMSASNPNARWRSAMLLGAVNTTAARDALEGALRDDDDDVRMNAALSLGKLGDGRAAEALRDLAVNDAQEVPVRTAAVRSLMTLRSGPHLPEMAELAGDRPQVYPEGEEPEEIPADETVLLRKTAVASLGVLGAAADPEIGSRVLNSLGSGAGTAAQAAMAVLAESASDLLEPDTEIRAVACTAIADLADGAGDEEATKRGLRTLMEALRDDPSGSVRIAAIDAINQIDVPQDMNDLVAAAREAATADPHYWVREAADSVGG